MRILLGHLYSEYSINHPKRISAWIGRLREYGFDVDAICISPSTSQPVVYWPELDHQWKTGDTRLLSMYEMLARKMEDYDVFLNYNGINLHPDFVRQMPGYKVYACFDDPESSNILSRPVAWSYDLALVGNIAEVETYRQWGVKDIRFWPMGVRVDDFDPYLTKEQILREDRDVDVVMLCERMNSWRRERLDKYAAAFPSGSFYGKGWPAGFLSDEQCVPLLRRSKIGINIHNSTGPINLRLYYLPANGVMQICDNKSHLGQIYELGREVIGFDSIEEAIDLTHYYLEHDDERRQVAADGWERAIRDYNEVAVFQRLVDTVAELNPKSVKVSSASVILQIRKQALKGKITKNLAILGKLLRSLIARVISKSREN